MIFSFLVACQRVISDSKEGFPLWILGQPTKCLVPLENDLIFPTYELHPVLSVTILIAEEL